MMARFQRAGIDSGTMTRNLHNELMSGRGSGAVGTMGALSGMARGHGDAMMSRFAGPGGRRADAGLMMGGPGGMMGLPAGMMGGRPAGPLGGVLGPGPRAMRPTAMFGGPQNVRPGAMMTGDAGGIKRPPPPDVMRPPMGPPPMGPPSMGPPPMGPPPMGPPSMGPPSMGPPPMGPPSMGPPSMGPPPMGPPPMGPPTMSASSTTPPTSTTVTADAAKVDPEGMVSEFATTSATTLFDLPPIPKKSEESDGRPELVPPTLKKVCVASTVLACWCSLVIVSKDLTIQSVIFCPSSRHVPSGRSANTASHDHVQLPPLCEVDVAAFSRDILSSRLYDSTVTDADD